MTDTEIRDIFHSASSGRDDHDPLAIERAWRDGSRRRVGARTAIVGSIAATAAAVTGIVMLDADSLPTTEVASPDSVEPAPPFDVAADIIVGTTSLRFSPTPTEELALRDVVGAPVPAVIDLAVEAPSATESPLRSAVAALAVEGDGPIDRLLLVDPDGERRWLDLSALTFDGDRVRPVTAQMLAPDGLALLFPQGDHVMRFDIPTGQWARLAIGAPGTERLGDGAVPKGPFSPNASATLAVPGNQKKPGSAARLSFTDPVGENFEPYGRAPSRGGQTVQSWLGSEFRVSVEGKTQRAMHLAIVDEGEREQGLLFNDEDSLDSPKARCLQCCTVVGWLDDDTVVYESRKAEPQLVAWTVGRDDFASVTRITGLPANSSYVASWAFSAL